MTYIYVTNIFHQILIFFIINPQHPYVHKPKEESIVSKLSVLKSEFVMVGDGPVGGESALNAIHSLLKESADSTELIAG